MFYKYRKLGNKLVTGKNHAQDINFLYNYTVYETHYYWWINAEVILHFNSALVDYVYVKFTN
jgi:hypothetical protein